jgi:hypothetical protein
MRAVLLAALVGAALAVDRSKFRRCDQAGFCKRHRGKASEPELRVMAGSVAMPQPGRLAATVHSDAPGAPLFDLSVAFYESGIARMRLTEVFADKPARWEVRSKRGTRWGARARAAHFTTSPLTISSATLQPTHHALPLAQSPDIVLESGTRTVPNAVLLDGGDAATVVAKRSNSSNSGID